MRTRWSLALLAVLALAAEPGGNPDETLLKSVGLRVDPNSLLHHFSQRLPDPAKLQRVDRILLDLGARSYAQRHAATVGAIAAGPVALPKLRPLLRSPDPEVAQRARECVQQIEADDTPAVNAAAARVLATYRPPGSIRTLLLYAPLADEGITDDLRAALATLARTEATGDEFWQALQTGPPAVRPFAAEALTRAGRLDWQPRLRPLLADPDRSVRLRAGLGLAVAGERAAIPALIELLGELPIDDAVSVEQLLDLLAGDDAPTVPLGDTPADRLAVRDAFRQWWDAHGPTADLARLAPNADAAGYLLAATPLRGVGGAVLELAADRTLKRTLEGLNYPLCAVMLPRDRVLVAEWRGNRVTERDFSGKILWEYGIELPVACQRRPGGRTFIATRGRVVEVDRNGKELMSFTVASLTTAAVRRDGLIVGVTSTGLCVTHDRTGREVSRFPVPRCMAHTGIDVLPDGRILVPDYLNNAVMEYAADGRELWKADTPRPASMHRLPNGLTLVTSTQAQHMVALDRAGKVVWEFKPSDGQRPWSSRGVGR